jgi:hypothetical protein
MESSDGIIIVNEWGVGYETPNNGERVRLGVTAPAEVPIHREEVKRKNESGLFQSARG